MKTFILFFMMFLGVWKMPVGMTQQIEETYEAVKPYGVSSVVFTMMELAMLISVNLGVLNLLPIPVRCCDP